MKLLLTSEGFDNDSIIQAFSKLLNKPFSETKLAFIPTAATIERGDKDWLIEDLRNCQKLQFKSIDIIDIAALPKSRWLPRIEKTDVLLFGGGNTYYLMQWLIKTGLKDLLPDLLKTRIYVGISAGSMAATTNFPLTYKHDVEFYNEEVISTREIKHGLEFVDFHIIPHLNSEIFPKVRIPTIASYAKNTSDTIYAIDDATAIIVQDSTVTVISEGVWKVFNPS